MTSVCMYFKVHQPFQLKKYHPKDVDVCHSYEDAASDKTLIDRLSEDCYLPANQVLLDLIESSEGRLKLSFSFSGTLLELLQRHRPDAIGSFRQLVSTGCVEILGETYYHSFSYLHSIHEFRRQVSKHRSLIEDLFGIEPAVFRNTELIYDNNLVEHIRDLGFKAILCEGIDGLLQDRSPNQIFSSAEPHVMPLLLRNSHLSDDIAFRFDDPYWSEYPLTADKFAEWLHQHPANTDVINLFMDYDTFGVHKKKETGIFDFLRALPGKVLAHPSFRFALPSEAIYEYCARDLYDVKQTISWDNPSATDGAWSKNVMQHNTLKKIYSLQKMVMSSGSAKAIDIWGILQTSDYFYYMGEERAKEIFEYYTNIVLDFEIGLIRNAIASRRKKSLAKGWNLLNNN